MFHESGEVEGSRGLEGEWGKDTPVPIPPHQPRSAFNLRVFASYSLPFHYAYICICWIHIYMDPTRRRGFRSHGYDVGFCATRRPIVASLYNLALVSSPSTVSWTSCILLRYVCLTPWERTYHGVRRELTKKYVFDLPTWMMMHNYWSSFDFEKCGRNTGKKTSRRVSLDSLCQIKI